jgi:hypothetical protein
MHISPAKEPAAKKDISASHSSKSTYSAKNLPKSRLNSLTGVNGSDRPLDTIASRLSRLPPTNRAPALRALQRSQGNRIVQQMTAGIQTKLRVGQPGDCHEQEADRVADEVMRMPEQQVQRQIEEDGEEELLQTKEVSGSTPSLGLGTGTKAVINAMGGGGSPLPPETHSFMKDRFGLEFSGVRIHTDAEAERTASALNAEAYTYGRDIYFGKNKYSPGTTSGKHLLAHELTHVVQQKSRPFIQMKTISGDYDSCIDEATDRKEDCLARGAALCAILALRIGKMPGAGGGGLCIMVYNEACQASYKSDSKFCKDKKKCLLAGVNSKKKPDECGSGWKGWISGGTGNPWPDFDNFKDWYDDWGKKPENWPPKVKLKHPSEYEIPPPWTRGSGSIY